MLSPPRMLGLIVALTLLLSGGVLAAGQHHRLSGYESTTGTMETARIDTLAVETAYAPDVTYTYTVDGERYYGENVASGMTIVTGNREKLESVLAVGQTGTRTVYYDPGNPDDAHLLHHYRFFPGAFLLVCGLLVLTDTITPNLRLVRFLTSWIPIETLERMPGVEPRTVTHAPDDPTAILENQRTWTEGERAPIRGGAVPAVWLLCYLFMTDLSVADFWLVSWPYDLWVVFTLFGVFAGCMRLTFSRLLD